MLASGRIASQLNIPGEGMFLSAGKRTVQRPLQDATLLRFLRPLRIFEVSGVIPSSGSFRISSGSRVSHIWSGGSRI